MDNTSPACCQLFNVNEQQYLLSTGPDLISRQLRKGHCWEPQTLAISRELIEGIDAPVLLDIGANLGAWSVPMGHHIRDRQGKIYAWEAQRQVYYQLCANLFINNLTHCIATNRAVGDRPGEIDVPVVDPMQDANVGALSLLPEVYKLQRGSGHQPRHEKVAIETLDAVNLPRADLIKIDVEGMELEVLSGAKAWLKRTGYPPLLLEVWGDYMTTMSEKKKQLLSLLGDELGYDFELNGELCIARHKHRTFPQTGQQEVAEPKQDVLFGMDFFNR